MNDRLWVKFPQGNGDGNPDILFRVSIYCITGWVEHPTNSDWTIIYTSFLIGPMRGNHFVTKMKISEIDELMGVK